MAEFTGPVIGIDLGTSNSCAAIYRHGRVEIIPIDCYTNSKNVPTTLAFTGSEILYGDRAKSSKVEPSNIINGIKRFIGGEFVDLEDAMKSYDYKICRDVLGKSKDVSIQIENNGEKQSFSAEEMMAMFLKKVKDGVELYLGEVVKTAVVAVPGHFNESQRLATIDACNIAGIRVLRLLNETTSVALTYSHLVPNKDQKNLIIFDMGGGFLNVSVVALKADDAKEVVANAGTDKVGGEEFTNRLVNHFIKEFRKLHGKDIFENPKLVYVLREECEKAKLVLSNAISATVDFVVDEKQFQSSITRGKYEELCKDLCEIIAKMTENAIFDSGLVKTEMHEAILVGGSTRMPVVQKTIKKCLDNKQMNKILHSAEAVAYGAALHGAIIAQNEDLKDVALVTDVSSHSIGIETASGDVMFNVIGRNCPLPAVATHTFTTYSDNQTRINLNVFEGERALSRDNKLFRSVDINNLPELPKGEPKVEVWFEVDINGVLHLAALDQNTKEPLEIFVK